MTFERWSERIAAADSERTRRELLAEIGRWRAARLTDIPALREAAFAMSRLYALLGDHEAATREGKALVSLCQTPPVALEEEIASAKAYLESLGERPVLAEKAARRAEQGRSRVARPPRREQHAKDGRRQEAVNLALRGRFDAALETLAGGRGPSTALVRTWVHLARALALTDAAEREAAIRAVEAELRARLAPKRPAQQAAAEKPPEPPRPEGTTDHPLSDLLGAPIPRKWKARLRLLEAWHAEHPDRIDDLAALALDHHVTEAGPRSPAPWLIGLVGQALASGEAVRTRETLARLRAAEAYAVTAYDEAPFAWLVGVLEAAKDRAWSEISLRRGISSRGEPRGRRIWTLRYTEDGVERQIAAAAPADRPYPDGVAVRLAERLVGLCPRTALVAPGEGNEGLRSDAAALGIAVAEVTTPGDLLGAAEGAQPVSLPTEAPAEVAGGSPAPAAEAPPEGDPVVTLRALLGAPEPPDEASLVRVLRAMPRLHPAFRAAQEVLEGLDIGTRTPRVRVFLRAADEAAPAHAHLPEGITLAVRTAAAGGEEVAEVLTGVPTSHRFGGPGVEVVLALAHTLAQDGWTVDRVLRGPTARERRNDAVLAALDDAGEGIWRITLAGGDSAAEVWHLSGLTPEGRAAVPHLLDGGPRVVVLADDDDLVAWFGTLGAEAVRWDGTGAAVRAAVGQPGHLDANT